MLAGLALITAGLALFVRVPVHGHYVTDVLPVMLLTGGGAGLAMPALMGYAMSSATPTDAGLVSGLFATGAQVGGALGLAVLAALATAHTNVLLAGGQATAQALTGGYHLAFGVSAAIAGSGILLAAAVLRSPAPPAAHTEDPHDEQTSSHAGGEPNQDSDRHRHNGLISEL